VTKVSGNLSKSSFRKIKEAKQYDESEIVVRKPVTAI
jgi:hypothetical protein